MNRNDIYETGVEGIFEDYYEGKRKNTITKYDVYNSNSKDVMTKA